MEINQKGTIQMGNQTYCIRKSEKHFELVTIDRTYYLFSDKVGFVDQWISEINKVLSTL
jgi:hypothetical protein